MDLSIVIVNYKAWDSLSVALNGLMAIPQSSPGFEVIVVDNCSGDGQLAIFKKAYPEFRFVENSGNWGFADACNLGAARALGHFFLFLNPDTIPNGEAIGAMYSTLWLNPEYGILSCMQNDRNESNIKLWPSLSTLLGFTRMVYRVIHRRDFQKRSCRSQSIARPDWISGSIVMISRKWFDQAGGWDNDFWLYSEDTDLSKKVVEKGGKIGVLCNYKMIHRHGGASRIDLYTTSRTKTEVKISSHVYIQKHFTGKTKAVGHGILILNNLLMNSPVAALGLVFFFIPQLHLFSRIYGRILIYYSGVLKTGTWISPRSKNYLVPGA